MMTKELVKALGLEITGEKGRILRMADQTPVSLIGGVKAVPTTVNGTTVEVNYMVAGGLKRLSYPAILGRPWLYRARIKEDWGKQEIRFGQSQQRVSWAVTKDGEDPEDESGEETMAPLTTEDEKLDPVWFMVEDHPESPDK